jgi:osmotically-inducible protein OsmY
MKTALLFFLIGVAAGAIGMGLYVERQGPAAPSLAARTQDTASAAVDRTKATAGSMRGTMEAKLAQWHLTGDDIKADLAKTGQVVREKGAVVGDAISDARILSVIKAKFVLDRDLSALAINVDVSGGAVTLKGTVDSADLIGKAVALALDTDGVRNVTSRLAVRSDI